MTKYILMIALSLVGSLANAANGYDGTKQATIARARPLIEAFLADHSAEFGVDLTPDPNGYHVRRSLAELVYWPAWPIVGGTRADYTCRPVDATIPSLARTARFYLRTTYAASPGALGGRYTDPNFALVRGCSVGALSHPPLLTLWPRTKRLFEDEEAVELTRAMVVKVRTGATDFRHEEPSRQNAWDVPDRVDLPFDEPDEDCRSISYALPGEEFRRTVGLLIRYDENRPDAKFPAESQSILKDKQSLRVFRLKVTGGCYGMSLYRPGLTGE